MDLISIPLGWLLRIIYQLVNNYGFAIILFTLITKFILFPLTLKQQKTMAQTQLIQPKLNELQKKYGEDREKFSEESMKLYKKYGVSPFSGCLPMLIQLPIIFALYTVIREPLAYIFSISGDEITNLIANNKELLEGVKPGSEQIILTAKLKEYLINYKFFGLDLAVTPELRNPNAIWIIPALSGLTTWISGKLMNVGRPKKEENTNKRPPRPGEKDPQASTNAMMNIMPFMTVWFAFMLPAGVGLYWVASNVFQMAQQFVLNKFYVPKIRERMAIENEELDSARKGRKKPGRRN